MIDTYKNLRVLVTKDEETWFAQGIQIDHAAQGKDIQEVKMNFELSLWLTIHENLKQYGTAEKILHSAPDSIYDEYMSMFMDFKKLQFINSNLSFKEELKQALGISSITYVYQFIPGVTTYDYAS
jgi:hypothetical protein